MKILVLVLGIGKYQKWKYRYRASTGKSGIGSSLELVESK